MQHKGSQLVALGVFVALVAAAALFGAMFGPGAWYTGLAKPAWTPPNWIFGPVWTALYVMIAIAGWLAWRSSPPWPAVMIWGAALVLNAGWSYLFFGRQAIGLALVDILALLVLIVLFIVTAWRRVRSAALLFVPYAFWVGFASALNLAIWRLNP